ncbi:MAG: hypothetical protein JEY79_03510 [Pseudodesulfovibrio sp.]|nr:hypothetical protein [Pseudodesulfovibrio sp.]
MMQDVMDYEKDLLTKLKIDNPGREISPLPKCGWGHSIIPAPDENPEKTGKGLRVLVIGSWTLGMLAFNAIRELECKRPDRVNIVGLVTDDPLDPNARISEHKRFWHYYGKHRQEIYEFHILEEALRFGVPCFTGEVKNDVFRSQLAKWKPEAIVVAGFGQLIDAPIIRYPDYGIYNVHPADLRNGYGAGPDPWEDLVARRAQTMRVSIHQVSEEIDTGPVVGVSPSINVRLADEECTDDVRLIGEKTFMPVKTMVAELVRGLCSNWESDRPCAISRIDLESCFSLPEREALMRPIDPEKRGTLLSLSPLCVRDTV